MRLLIAILLFVSPAAFGGAWVTGPDYDIARSGGSGFNVITLKKDCNGICYNLLDCKKIADGDLRHCAKGLVDNLKKPILRDPDLSPVKVDCADFKSCASKAGNPDDDLDTKETICAAEPGSVERWDRISNWPDVTGVSGPWFIWCEIGVGFEKKPGLVLDVAGKAAADAADAAKAAEDAAKKSKRTARLDSLVACAKTKIADMTAAIQKNCLRDIARELMRQRLQSSEQ